MYNKFMQTFYRLDEGGYTGGAVDVAVPDEPTEEHTGEGDQSTEVSVKPKTRREHFLDKIGGGTGIPGVSPKTREEVLLNNAASNEGSSGGTMIVHEDKNRRLDKTWQEIHDAALVGFVILVHVIEDAVFGLDIVVEPCVGITSDSKGFGVKIYSYNVGEIMEYNCDNADDYPVYK